MTSILIIVLILLLNAFFVAAEYGLVKAKNIKLQQLADENSATARLVLLMRKDLEKHIATCQIGITMASIGLGYAGEPAFLILITPIFNIFGLPAEHISLVSFLVGFVVISSFTLVLGEMVPKTFAVRRPEQVALWVAYPLKLFNFLTYPLVHLLHISSRSILNIFRVKEVSYADYMTGEELRDMIDFSEEHGGIETSKAEMLSNLFEIDSRTVSQIMVSRGDVSMLDLQAPVAENIKVMLEQQHSRMPLIDGDPDEFIGIILTKELFNAILKGESEPWKDLRKYARPPLVVPEAMAVGKCFEIMRRKQALMALVVDEYGSLVGLVTLEDLLEEIVGEIADELDDATPEYVAVNIGTGWLADGLISLTDLARTIDDFIVPDEIDANTLSGLIMSELQDIPKSGDTITISGYHILVKEVVDRYVEKAFLTKIPEPAEEN